MPRSSCSSKSDCEPCDPCNPRKTKKCPTFNSAPWNVRRNCRRVSALCLPNLANADCKPKRRHRRYKPSCKPSTSCKPKTSCYKPKSSHCKKSSYCKPKSTSCYKPKYCPPPAGPAGPQGLPGVSPMALVKNTENLNIYYNTAGVAQLPLPVAQEASAPVTRMDFDNFYIESFSDAALTVAAPMVLVQSEIAVTNTNLASPNATFGDATDVADPGTGTLGAANAAYQNNGSRGNLIASAAYGTVDLATNLYFKITLTKAKFLTGLGLLNAATFGGVVPTGARLDCYNADGTLAGVAQLAPVLTGAIGAGTNLAVAGNGFFDLASTLADVEIAYAVLAMSHYSGLTYVSTATKKAITAAPFESLEFAGDQQIIHQVPDGGVGVAGAWTAIGTMNYDPAVNGTNPLAFKVKLANGPTAALATKALEVRVAVTTNIADDTADTAILAQVSYVHAALAVTGEILPVLSNLDVQNFPAAAATLVVRIRSTEVGVLAASDYNLLEATIQMAAY